MKVWAGLLSGVVLGVVLGGVGPRADLRDSALENARLEGELAKAQRSAARLSRRKTALPALIPNLPRLEEPDTGAPPEDVPRSGLPESSGPDQPAERRYESGSLASEDVAAARSDGFDAAVDAQAIRAAQVRAALGEQADLSDAELVEVDRITADMNARLSEYAVDLMDLAVQGESADPRDVLSISHDVTGVLLDSQDELDDLVGEDRIAQVDPNAAGVWNHVDLEVFRDAIEDGDVQP